MFTIDICVKNTAFPMSIQRKSAEEAEALYKRIITAIQSGQPAIMELECEGKVEKKIAIHTTEISAIQISKKDGVATGSGRPPGFLTLTE